MHYRLAPRSEGDDRWFEAVASVINGEDGDEKQVFSLHAAAHRQEQVQIGEVAADHRQQVRDQIGPERGDHAEPQRPVHRIVVAARQKADLIDHGQNHARTLDDLVKEMLRPMLKSWLDDNLPSIVERIVRAEIERVSRGRG